MPGWINSPYEVLPPTAPLSPLDRAYATLEGCPKDGRRMRKACLERLLGTSVEDCFEWKVAARGAAICICRLCILYGTGCYTTCFAYGARGRAGAWTDTPDLRGEATERPRSHIWQSSQANPPPLGAFWHQNGRRNEVVRCLGHFTSCYF